MAPARSGSVHRSSTESGRSARAKGWRQSAMVTMAALSISDSLDEPTQP